MNQTTAMGMIKLRLLDDGETVEVIGTKDTIRLSALDLTDDQLRKLRDGRILKHDSVPMKSVDWKVTNDVSVPPTLECSLNETTPEDVEKLLDRLAPAMDRTIREFIKTLSDVVPSSEALARSLSRALRETEHGNDSARESLGQLGIGSGTAGGGSGTSGGFRHDGPFIESVRREITEKVRAVEKEAVVCFGRDSFDGGVFFFDKTRQNEILAALHSVSFVEAAPPQVFDDGVSICFKPSVESASLARNSGPKALWWQEHLAQKKERLRKHAERLLLDDDPESKSYHVGTHFLTIWDGVSKRLASEEASF